YGVTPAGFGGKYGWHIMRLFEFLLEVTAGPELHDALLLGEANWDQQAVVEAFDLFLTWDSRGWITEGALGVAPADAEQSFVQGTSAYTISGPWIETQYIAPSGQPREEFSTFLLPTGHDDLRHSGRRRGPHRPHPAARDSGGAAEHPVRDPRSCSGPGGVPSQRAVGTDP